MWIFSFNGGHVHRNRGLLCRQLQEYLHELQNHNRSGHNDRGLWQLSEAGPDLGWTNLTERMFRGHVKQLWWSSQMWVLLAYVWHKILSPPWTHEDNIYFSWYCKNINLFKVKIKHQMRFQSFFRSEKGRTPHKIDYLSNKGLNYEKNDIHTWIFGFNGRHIHRNRHFFGLLRRKLL